MTDEDAQSGVTKPKKDKPKTAVDANAPGGPEFRDPNNPLASGGDAVLGDQVRPETQTREDDGHRTLASPVTDPGPYVPDGHAGWRNPMPGETLNEVNDGVTVTQRHSTAPEYFSREGSTMDVVLGAHVVGMEGKASQVYNPEQGDGLTDVSKRKSAEQRVLAPGALASDEAEGSTAA